MQISAPIEATQEGRMSVSLEISLAEHIQETFTQPKTLLSRDEQGTIPFTLYQHQGDYITLATDRVLHFTGEKPREIPVKPFRNRLAPVASYNKEARLLIFFPGKIHLGYINKNDVPKAKKWLETLVKNIEEDIPAALNNHINNKEAEKTITTTAIKSEKDIQGIEVTNDIFGRAAMQV